MNRERMLEALKARGVVPHRKEGGEDLRDAVHEAVHALQWDVPAPWSRRNISRRAPKGNGAKLLAEVEARAVERVVCERLGHPLDDDPDEWLLVSAMESVKVDNYHAPWDTWVVAGRNARENPRTVGLVERVLALAGEE